MKMILFLKFFKYFKNYLNLRKCFNSLNENNSCHIIIITYAFRSSRNCVATSNFTLKYLIFSIINIWHTILPIKSLYPELNFCISVAFTLEVVKQFLLTFVGFNFEKSLIFKTNMVS